MPLVNLLKLLLDDFVRYRWRDLVAIFMLVFGFWVILHSQDPMARGEAKGLIGAGLIMLDPRGLVPSAQPSNNNSKPPEPAVKTPSGWEARSATQNQPKG